MAKTSPYEGDTPRLEDRGAWDAGLGDARINAVGVASDEAAGEKS